MLRTVRNLFVFAVLCALAIALTYVNRVELDAGAEDVHVSDGDSLRIGAERIRLFGIDAPEYQQTCTVDGQDIACGRIARDHLRELARSGPVTCIGHERDRYDRLLARCRAGAVELNARMVEDGWAVAYGAYQSEEREARAAGNGLWRGSFQSPRDYREENGIGADLAAGTLSRFFHWLGGLF